MPPKDEVWLIALSIPYHRLLIFAGRNGKWGRSLRPGKSGDGSRMHPSNLGQRHGRVCIKERDRSTSADGNLCPVRGKGEGTNWLMQREHVRHAAIRQREPDMRIIPSAGKQPP